MKVLEKVRKRSFARWISRLKTTAHREVASEAKVPRKVSTARTYTDSKSEKMHLWFGTNPIYFSRLSPLRERGKLKGDSGGVVGGQHFAPRAFIYKNPKTGKISVLRQEGPRKKDLKTVHLAIKDLIEPPLTRAVLAKTNDMAEEISAIFAQELNYALNYEVRP